jgi:hypothetical protein
VSPLLFLPLLAGCAPDDACAQMCDAALDSFEGCLDERGTEWGASVGYSSPADYRNWCETYSWELRQLGEVDQCAQLRDAVTGVDCAGYASAWESAP